MKHFWLFGLILGLTACVSSTTQSKTATIPTSASSLPDLGPAPELTNETWLNVDTTLRLTDLRGKVVAIDMWTFG